MTEKKRKPKEGGPRSAMFSLRLDPKLKYLAEIAARKQRRPLSNFVEWAIEQALAQVELKLSANDSLMTVENASSRLWALDEADRLSKLANHFFDLLSYDEQLIWSTICNHSVLEPAQGKVIGFKSGRDLDWNLIRKCWPAIKSYSLNTGTTERELNELLLKHYRPLKEV